MGQKILRAALIGAILISTIDLNVKTFEMQTPESPDNIRNEAQLNQNVVSSRMTYGRFLEYLEMGWVKQVDLYDNSRNAIVQASSPELGNRPQTIRVEIPVGASQLIQKLKEYNIDFDAHPAEQKNLFVTIASNLLLPLIFIAGLVYFFQNSENFGGGSGQSPLSLGKSTARFEKRPDTGINFSDIAGVDEAKAEFEEVVSFLKEPEKYTVVGAKIPKGILLVGPPGTGKTLLAKAIANEADVPFFSVAGSEFVEMFIGIGAARVRDLFQKAGENAPCIVFIDEIDAVGRERGAGVGGGNDEREQTLNQLLTEMDGFKENKGVIVVGATNRVDILDAALLRPGRFDRQVTVNLPDRLGRISILKVHAKNKPLGEDVSLVQLANRTPGFSGADLANLLNEAAILATRYKKSTISKNEVNQAIDRVIGGIAGTPMEDSKNKKLIAYHEVGHAITGTVLQSHDEVEKISITPRGTAKGLTWFTPDEDQSLISRSGQMVTRFGMSNIGPIALEDESNGQVFLGATMNQESEYPESIADRIDDEVCKIINYCEEKALQIILDNRVIIDLVVERLLDVETMEGDEFRELLSTYTILPNKNSTYISKLAQ